MRQRLELLKRNADGQPALVSAVEQIDAEIEEILRTFDAMLKLAELENDHQGLRLQQVDLAIARDYAGLVSDPKVRSAVFGMIEQEYALTSAMLLRVTEGTSIGARFPQLRMRLARKLPPSARQTACRLNCCAVIAARQTRRRGSPSRRHCCCP